MRNSIKATHLFRFIILIEVLIYLIYIEVNEKYNRDKR